eukprot:361902-Chlamydomonas_euryale.AAC.3
MGAEKGASKGAGSGGDGKGGEGGTSWRGGKGMADKGCREATRDVEVLQFMLPSVNAMRVMWRCQCRHPTLGIEGMTRAAGTKNTALCWQVHTPRLRCYVCGVWCPHLDELAEPRRVVVAQRLCVAKSLQHRVGL